MAKGSPTGWFGLEPSKRFCPGCGEKLTLKGSGPLWHESFPVKQTWHSRCRLEAGKRNAAA